MPMLKLPYVPAHYAGHQTAYLLHNSEYFFPPLNGIQTLSNVVLTGLAYYYSRSASANIPGTSAHLAAAKFPRLAIAAALNFATTAWALGIMVPMNKRMAILAKELENSEAGEPKYTSAEKELRRLQTRWQKLNYGRACLMVGAALAGVSALLIQV